jgi:MFS family permease
MTHENRPPLLQDRSFWGLNLTQFFGAFNDNLFRQTVMLICTDQARQGGQDLQGLASILFAVPFIGISGYAGFLSDRYSKRTIIVLCKFAEVAIILLGLIGFLTHSLPFLLAVLCLMGVHSAFFGPSKYGILPEMLRPEDLPRANGMVLMATFLAIIFGLAAAGATKHFFDATLWLASLPCLVISFLGLTSSLMIRKTPAAQPTLQFHANSLFISPEIRQLLRSNLKLLNVLLVSSVFWFVAGTVYPPAINSLGKQQFGLDDLITGLLAASTGVGIAVGCVAAGILSKNRVRGWIVKLGAWGITLSLLCLALPGPGWSEIREQIRMTKESKLASNQNTAIANTAQTANDNTESPTALDRPMPADEALKGMGTATAYYRGTLLGPWGSAVALVSLGIFAGFYSVPLQVYLQASAPVDQKGRIIGANNLIQWIAIALSGGIYSVGKLVLVDWLMLPYAALFGLAGAVMLPVALFYRPPDGDVEAIEQ